MNCSIVVFTFLGFVIAAEIDPDQPPAVASCDDLANFVAFSTVMVFDFFLGIRCIRRPYIRDSFRPALGRVSYLILQV